MKYRVPDDNSQRHHDIVAAKLSIVPGLGQVYKGHWLEACAVFTGAVAFLIWLGTIICLAYAMGTLSGVLGAPVDWTWLLINPITIGMGLLPVLLFWTWEVLDAFDEPDMRHDGRRSLARIRQTK